jgi:hypothetical protein
MKKNNIKEITKSLIVSPKTNPSDASKLAGSGPTIDQKSVEDAIAIAKQQQEPVSVGEGGFGVGEDGDLERDMENLNLTNDIGKDDYMDDEGRFAKSQIHKMAHYATKLTDMLNDMEQLPSWVQSKLTRASDYMSMVYHYLEYEFAREGDNLNEHLDNHKKIAKRTTLMEGAMKKFFNMFDTGMTDEEIIQDFASRGTQVPDAFIASARKNWNKAKELELALDMGEAEFKNSARDIVNNPEGEEAVTGMEPMKEKQLASGLTSEDLDPVGQEDDDINNDGKVDKTDKYLKNKRNKINKSIKSKK